MACITSMMFHLFWISRFLKTELNECIEERVKWQLTNYSDKYQKIQRALQNDEIKDPLKHLIFASVEDVENHNICWM